MANLEDVFKKAGVPTYTFVAPREYTKILVALRTPGRALVIEGPSGIGKTSCVKKAISGLGATDACNFLSARKPADLAIIKKIPTSQMTGYVVVDDFHRLDTKTRRALTDYVKALADDEQEDPKVVLIGINRAGQSLIDYAPDLLHRVESIRFGRTSIENLRELIQLGEVALNCKIDVGEALAEESEGSFAMAQVLCHEACIQANLLETSTNADPHDVSASLPAIREAVLEDLGSRFFRDCRSFAKGNKLRKEGRAPYLHLLKWLSETKDGTLDTKEAMSANQNLKGSVSQVIEKGHLSKLIRDTDGLKQLLFFDEETDILTTEDPKFHYFIRHLIWSKFSRQVGFYLVDFENQYDFALSFAGQNRELAEALFNKLQEREISVFYDKNEQSRILANDVEEYLAPIYRSDARFIIAILSKDYPNRIWTKFESGQFKSRFGDNSVIPIVYKDHSINPTDLASVVGYMSFDPDSDINSQVEEISNLLARKITQDREEVATSAE